MHIQIIILTAHLLLGNASTYPQKRKLSLEIRPKAICFKTMKKILFIFAWLNVKILLGNSLVTNQAIRLVGLVRKLIEFGCRVFVTLSSLQMVVLFLRITIMWVATLERNVKRQCGFITLSYSNFSILNTKMFRRSISSMILIPCLSVTAPTMSIRNMQTYSTIRRDFSMCGWVRGFSQFKCSDGTS